MFDDVVEIKLARGALKNVDSVPEEIWEQILESMENTFACHDPEKIYGETIDEITGLAVPRFRFKWNDWRVGYCVTNIFMGKRVYIYCCFPRGIFYDVLKKKGIRL